MYERAEMMPTICQDSHWSSRLDVVLLTYFNNFKIINNLFFSSLALWSTERKKPVVTVKNAHGDKLVNGTETVNGNSEAVNGNSAGPLPENWITAIAALHNTDFVVSGESGSIAIVFMIVYWISFVHHGQHIDWSFVHHCQHRTGVLFIMANIGLEFCSSWPT